MSRQSFIDVFLNPLLVDRIKYYLDYAPLDSFKLPSTYFIPASSIKELDYYEMILGIDDYTLYDWLLGTLEAPEKFRRPTPRRSPSAARTGTCRNRVLLSSSWRRQCHREASST